MFFEVAQPSGEAKTTGTPTRRASDNATNEKSESWKRNNI